MDVLMFACNIGIRRHEENRELQTFSIVISQEKNLIKSITLGTKKYETQATLGKHEFF